MTIFRVGDRRKCLWRTKIVPSLLDWPRTIGVIQSFLKMIKPYLLRRLITLSVISTRLLANMTLSPRITSYFSSSASETIAS